MVNRTGANAIQAFANSSGIRMTAISGGGGTAVRWEPGHYIQFGLNDTVASRQATIASIASIPSIVGVVDPWFWNVMEGATSGSYNFTNPQAVLSTCVANGKSYILDFCSRQFNNTQNPAVCLPQYVINNNWYYSRIAPNTTVGAALWIQDCMIAKYTAEQAAMTAMGSTTNFVAISSDETVFGPNLTIPAGGANYNLVNYTANEFARWTALRRFGPQLAVLVYTNELNGDNNTFDTMNSFFTTAVGLGGVLINNGPDALFSTYLSTPIPSQEIMDGRIHGVDYRGGANGILLGVQGAETSSTTFANVFSEFDTYYGAQYQQWYENAWSPLNKAGLISFLTSHPVTHTAYPSSWPT